MRSLVIAAVLSMFAGTVFAGTAFAQGGTCKAEASAKKLAGAALNSFMTKCEKDATTACEADSKAKKLSGAAATSHTKKCVSDKVGA